MKSIDIATLTDVVRTNLDEIGVNESMMLEGSDDVMLYNIVERIMGESADEVHMAAPAIILDGMTPPDVRYLATGKVLKMVMRDMLRLVAFKAKDSDYVVSETIPEASAEGRMQLDPYLQGTYDSPKMVLRQGLNEDTELEMRYYSLKEELKTGETSKDKVDYLLAVPRQIGETSSVSISENAIYVFYNLVTAKVLTILGEMEKAQIYYGKAKFE